MEGNIVFRIYYNTVLKKCIYFYDVDILRYFPVRAYNISQCLVSFRIRFCVWVLLNLVQRQFDLKNSQSSNLNRGKNFTKPQIREIRLFSPINEQTSLHHTGQNLTKLSLRNPKSRHLISKQFFLFAVTIRRITAYA